MVHIEPGLEVPRDFEGKCQTQLLWTSVILLLISSHIGFGEEGFDPKWPNGARIAVSFVLNYEYVAGPSC